MGGLKVYGLVFVPVAAFCAYKRQFLTKYLRPLCAMEAAPTGTALGREFHQEWVGAKSTSLRAIPVAALRTYNRETRKQFIKRSPGVAPKSRTRTAWWAVETFYGWMPTVLWPPLYRARGR